jgi:hypothetical protein
MAAVLGLAALPAFADLAPSALSPLADSTAISNGSHTTGPYVGGTIPGDVVIDSTSTTTFSVTFAFHWPYNPSQTLGIRYAAQLWSSLVWDSDEIQITDVTTAPGPFFGDTNSGTAADNNYNAATFWPTVVNQGVRQAGDVLGTGVPLWQNANTFQTLDTPSAVFPFLKVDFNVFNPVDDGNLDIVIGSAAMLYLYTGAAGTFWTGGGIGETFFGFEVLPEPASLALLGLGIASTSIGVWRRRRA